MNGTIAHQINLLIARIVDWSQRRHYLVIAMMLLLTAVSASYTTTHIGINTDTEDMLSERLAWRIAYKDFNQAFPFFSDTIVVVIDGATPDVADEAAATLAAALSENQRDFTEVFNPSQEPFCRRNQLLYATTDDLERLTDQLSGAQALLGRLAQQPDLGGLLSLLGELASHDAQTELPEATVRFLRVLGGAIDELLAGDDIAMSWQNLLLGDTATQPSRIMFTLQPKLDFSAILSAKDAISAVRHAIADLGYDAKPGLTVRLTGGAALGHDELSSVIRGVEQAGLVAFVMIAVCLGIGLGSLSLVIATLVTLLAGLILTATFAALAVGTLNMISVAFAVLYVGLGVDFAIHLCLRYRELCGSQTQFDAIAGATRHLGSSLLLCAATTAIAFFAFIPTAYVGVAELGLISGTGMLIGLITSLTLLPALLQALPKPRGWPAASGMGESQAPARTTIIIVLAALGAIVGAGTLPSARFDLNPLHLNDPSAESVTTLADLASSGEQPLHTISLIVADPDERSRLVTQLTSLDSVAGVDSVVDLVPVEQERKLAIIEDLRWALGDIIVLGDAVAPTVALISDALRQAEAALRRPSPDGAMRAARDSLADAVARLGAQLHAMAPAAAAHLLTRTEHKLMHHFATQLLRLGDSLEASALDIESLPPTLRQRWVADDGRYRLEVRPSEDLNDNAALIRFVDSVRLVAGTSATGTPIINVEASRTVTSAFYQAFISAAALITLLLWTILRRLREVLIVLAPLALAGLLTCAVTVAADIPFNFANIIALPLLMGIGVDSALHILHRYKTSAGGALPLLRTSTARAVLFSALTTTASFGNLALSPHAGTASMGIMLSIGLAISLLCTLVVLPALLRRYVPVALAPL